MRKIRYFLAAFAALLLFVLNVNVAYAAGNTVYRAVINDEADLLTPEDENRLMEEMEALLGYGHAIFQTVNLETGDYEGYAENTYYQMFGNDPGVIFQIDMTNRKLTLSASTGMEEIIGSERDSIVDNIYELATDGDYYACAKECFHEIDLVVHDGEIAHKMKHINNAICAVILGLLLNFFLAFATTRKKVNMKKLLGGVAAVSAVSGAVLHAGKVSKRYSPVSSDSGGGFGGGSSGGGGGGGGFSGGSSSHGF